MLKLLGRYSLAGMTALVLILWIAACIYPFSITYAGTEKWQLNIHPGALTYKHATIPDPLFVNPQEQGFSIEHSEFLKPSTIWQCLSLQWPTVGSERNSIGTYSPARFYVIPFWIIFSILGLLSLVVWVRGFRDGWRKKHQRGFAVEIEEKNERQIEEIAKE